ncbi:MAG: NYN domain-containing protein [Gammaproteobacteria bacterium]|nr:NYN domain-containing protein [Gammaproteobacteria bacterium]
MSRFTKTGVGIYVDAANIQINGGYGMHYDVLREFSCHDSGDPVRLNSYVTFDEKRAKVDAAYNNGANKFFSTLRDFGYKVIIKNYKWYKDEEGNAYAKANSDLDMAVDVLLQSEKLGRVLLATGDGDFVQVVRALQNRGCRVEVVAFDNVSYDLRREADVFISGYLIPNLLPIKNQTSNAKWGEEGSRVRGICYFYNREAGYGFMRFMKEINADLWITDTRREDSPYLSVYFNANDLPSDISLSTMPSYDTVFEFDVKNSTVKEGRLQAYNIKVI